nr:hypothetical protein [Actinomyces oris]
MAATDRDIFIDVGISIAKLLLIASGQGALAAAVGEGAGLLAKLRGTLEIGGKRAVFAEKIADDAAKQLLGKHEGISEADWHVATRQVVSLIDRLSEKERLAAGYNCDELRRTLLDLGGTDLRSDLADESARHAFDWVLEVACQRIVDCFTEKEALASILERVDEVSTGVQRLLDRPAGASQTDDVVNYHIKIVRDLAPDPLEDREQEIAELETFVRGSEDAWYALEASMVSGKTALMSSFALNPPDDVHIVSFFIRRIGGDGNDRESFALVMGAQLGNILGHEYVEDVSEGRRPVEFHKLLRQAATACLSSAVPQTLVLVIDGLDEDSYFEKSDGQDAKSILSMLPKCLPGGVKVVTAARRNPRLPEDVQCEAKRRVVSLKSSPIAEKFINIKEIEKFFRTSMAVDIVAFLAACGDALTVKDLTKLLVMYRGQKILPHDVSMYVDRSPGRILDAVDVGDCSQGVAAYRLGHDLVMQTVIRMLDPDSFGEGDEAGDLRWLAVIRDNALGPYRSTIREWVEECADRGWRHNTPNYVLSDPCFDLMLTDKGGDFLSVQIVLQRDRYEELLRRSGSRSSVLRMIDREYFKALEMNHGELPEGVLTSLLEVAEFRGNFARTGVYVSGLLRLYALHFNVASETILDMVLTVDDLKDRLIALKEVMKAAVESERDCSFLSSLLGAIHPLVSYRYVRDGFLCLLVNVLVFAADVKGDSCSNGSEDFDLAAWFRGVFVSDGADEFPQMLYSCGIFDGLGKVALKAPSILVVAERMAKQIGNPEERVEALLSVSCAWARAGQTDRARRIVEDAVNLAEQVEDVMWLRKSGEVLMGVVTALVRVKLFDEALDVAERVPVWRGRAGALLEIAGGLACADETERAWWVVEDAVSLVEQIEQFWLHDEYLVEVVAALVRMDWFHEALRAAKWIGDPAAPGQVLGEGVRAPFQMDQVDEFLEVTERIGVSGLRFGVLVEIVGALARASETGKARQVVVRAMNLADEFEDSSERAKALLKIANVLADAGETEWALQVAEKVPKVANQADEFEDSSGRAKALLKIANVLADVGEIERVRRIACKAAMVAERFKSPLSRAEVLVRVANVVADIGETEWAWRVVDNAVKASAWIDDSSLRAQNLVDVVDALIRMERIDEGLELSGRIDDYWWRSKALVEVVGALARMDRVGMAFCVAEQFKDPMRRTEALAEIAIVLTRVGRIVKARRVVENLVSAAKRIEDPELRAQVLYGVVMKMVRVDWIDGSLYVAEQIESTSWRARALMEITGAMAHAGRVDEALGLGEGIEVALSRGCALAEVASELAKVGKGDQARWVIESALGAVAQIGGSYRREPALIRVAGALAGVGDINETLKVVSMIDESNSRSRAHSAILKELVREGSLGEAVSTLRIALTEVEGIARRQEAADYCAVLATACLEALNLIDASSSMRERWLGLTRSVLARSWLYGASVWDHFDILMRAAPELAVQLVDERILADPEQGTAPESDLGLGPEGPGGEAGSYR